MGVEAEPLRPKMLSMVVPGVSAPVLPDLPPSRDTDPAKLVREPLLCNVAVLGSCRPDKLLLRDEVELNRPLLSSEVFPSSPSAEGDESHEMLASELNAPSPPEVDSPPSEKPCCCCCCVC